MASSAYEDDSSDSNLSQDFLPNCCDSSNSLGCTTETRSSFECRGNFNVIHKLNNRQLYGRVTKDPKAKTERFFDYIHYQCKYKIDQLITSSDLLSHIFMGFTLCGQFFISYKEKLIEDTINLFPTIEYELYIWRFIPGQQLRHISSHRVFKLLKGPDELDEIIFMQFPTDPYKLICYGLGLANPVMAFLTILTLPTSPSNCKYCRANSNQPNSSVTQGWCMKHGFMLHYMFSLAQPAPAFDPYISLAFPDFLVINTDSKRDESSKWIKKVVRRYSSVDFETSSLVSGQSRDDYNIPIEIPLIVQTLFDQQLDIVPEFKADQITETQLTITQRTFDCEQFVQRRAQKLCTELQLEFLHCEDYDIKLLHICPIDGHIVCQAVIKIGALQIKESHCKPDVYISNCIFTWNIVTDAFELIEPPDHYKLQRLSSTSQMFHTYIPRSNCKQVLVMDFDSHKSKKYLRDYQKNFEIVMENKEFYRNWHPVFQAGYSTVSDSE